jgi:tRNA pseudouridine38-40 synthase
VPTFRITVAYDGTDFVGWQRQAAGASIQGELEAAVRALDEREVAVVGAGRTDAGVHALGQVAAFTIYRELAAETVLRALNARLPATIRVLDAEEAPSSFHPQFDARAKTYRYRIWNGGAMSPFERRYAWHLPGPLDVDAMCAAARLIEGEHDFAAFQGGGSDVATTVRTVFSSQIRAGSHPAPRTPHPVLWEYEITGSGFLRHMVRTIVGTLVEVGRRRAPVEWVGRVVESRDRRAAGQTAPARGLFLVAVDYGAALASDV